uniref:Uncharacterized protein n=1 Tax=Meloidogyne floridensis TaxID=298350 RepID=A0A915NQ17_9BILA
MPCSTAILLSQIVLFYDLIRIIISDDDQTVSNIINLDNHQFSNFYRWMEQNSHICKSAIQNFEEDTPLFLKEVDSINSDCATICGNPLDIPHLACGKRPSQSDKEWPKLPPLCMLNFVQENMALKIALGLFRIEHLIAAVNQQNNRKIGEIPKNNSNEKIFPFGQLLVDSETFNKMEEKPVRLQAKKSEMGNKVNELLSSLKEINCQIFDREPESCKFWVNKGECNLNPVMFF